MELQEAGRTDLEYPNRHISSISTDTYTFLALQRGDILPLPERVENSPPLGILDEEFELLTGAPG